MHAAWIHSSATPTSAVCYSACTSAIEAATAPRAAPRAVSGDGLYCGNSLDPRNKIIHLENKDVEKLN